MYLTSRFALIAVASFLLLETLIPLAQSHAASGAPIQLSIPSPSGIPTGARRATEADQADIEAAGLTYTPGMLWDPKNPYAGQSASDAKQFLRNILCSNGGDYGGAGPDGTIRELNPEFSVCAAKFLRFAQQNGRQICIKEGYRTEQKQRQYVAQGVFACKYGARCEHPQGIAIDVNSDNYPWLWNNACQFGLDFYLRSRDQVHFVPLSHSISRGKSTCRGGVPTNCLDPNFMPRSFDVAGPPSSGLSSAARNFLNPVQHPQQMCPLPGGGSVPCSSIANLGSQPAPAATTPQGAPPPVGVQNTTPYAPGTCAPTFYCSDNNLYYRTSTCVDQVNQVCENGCEGTSCKGSRQNVSDILGAALSKITSAPTSTDKKSTSSLSAFEQISLLINPNAVGSAATSAPLVLTVTGEEAARLEGNPPPGTLPPPTYGVLPPGASQTFVSGDLMESPYVSPREVSGFQAVLSSMRERLERILAYLRPFGRPADSYDAYYNEWAE